MGVTIQCTCYSKILRKILQDDTVTKPDDEVTVVSGNKSSNHGSQGQPANGNNPLSTPASSSASASCQAAASLSSNFASPTAPNSALHNGDLAKQAGTLVV